jgi:3-dehydroquinate synthase
MKILNVNLGERSYPIYIGQQLFSDAGIFKAAIVGKQALIVSNSTVAPLYLRKVQDLLSAFCETGVLVLPDGEQYKQLDVINKIYDELLSKHHHRTTTLIALGGGVIGDMTGFAAATYQRGVNFVQIPTTLLSQVDSSVGGKTGVNHAFGKNMIGAFHQPKAVMIDTDVLSTLPIREFSAGMAEVIKYGLIKDAKFFAWLEANMALLMHRDRAALEEAIEISCRTKAGIVAVDEREEGVRALLNFGHTFGHAIETHQGYGRWLHGEAVASGMVIAATVSARRGWLPQESLDRIRHLLQKAGLPLQPPADMQADDFLQKMQLDKKVMTGKIRYILLKTLGSAVVSDDVSATEVAAAISDCR